MRTIAHPHDQLCTSSETTVPTDEHDPNHSFPIGSAKLTRLPPWEDFQRGPQSVHAEILHHGPRRKSFTLAAIHGFRPCRAAAFALLPFMHPAANCWAKRRPPDKVTIYAYFRKVRIQRVVIMIGCVNRVELTSQQDRIHPNCLAKWCLALQTICQVRLTFKEISFHGVADRLRNPLMLSLNHPIVENQL